MIENKYLNLLSNQPKPLRVGQKTHTSDYKLEWKLQWQTD